MNEAQLEADMQRAVDDVFAPSDLLERAKQANRRRRAVAGGVGSVVAVVALTLSVVYILAQDTEDAAPSAAGRSGAASSPAAASGERLDPGVPRPGDKYWHVVSFDAANRPKSQTLEQWTDNAGHTFVPPSKSRASKSGCTCGGFEISGVATIVSYAQIAALPTDPAKLRGYLGERWDSLPGKLPPMHIRANERIIGIDEALTSLLAQVPAPLAVRRAAFEALAQSPHRVKAPHPATTVVLTGYKLPDSKTGTDQPSAADRHTVVVDPGTMQLTREISYRDGTTITRKAGWVPRLP